MSRVLMACGPAGAGKTTWACGLEREGFVRLSIDETAWAHGLQSHPLADGDRDTIEAELRMRLTALVRAGRDVVLDYAFASRRARDDYRRLLRGLGVEPQTVYLATPREIALARVRARDGRTAASIRLPDEVAARYFDEFEAPSPDEGPLVVLR